MSEKIQAVKEPTGLCKDGKRPDGASIISWKRGRIVTWDVTVAVSFAASYIKDTQGRHFNFFLGGGGFSTA